MASLRIPGMKHAEEFSRRLAEALRQAGLTARPNILEREFNLVYHGNGVCYQTARKWLNGTSIPRQDKLETLAHWLGVSPQYLRFGEDSPATVQEKAAAWQHLPRDATALMEDYLRLTTPQRKVVRDMVANLLAAGSAD